MDKKNHWSYCYNCHSAFMRLPGSVWSYASGSTSVLASLAPGADIDVFGSSDPSSATTMGIVFLCLSMIFIAIPIVVGVMTLRKKPGDDAAPVVVDAEPSPKPVEPVDNEPLPPAS